MITNPLSRYVFHHFFQIRERSLTINTRIGPEIYYHHFSPQTSKSKGFAIKPFSARNYFRSQGTSFCFIHFFSINFFNSCLIILLSSNLVRPIPYWGKVFKIYVWNVLSTLKNMPIAVTIITTPKTF